MRTHIHKTIGLALASTLVGFSLAATVVGAVERQKDRLGSPDPAGSQRPAVFRQLAAQSDTTSKRANRYPIRGKVKAVDAVARTFTLSGTAKDRVFRVDDSTIVTRHGKPATLAEVVRGDEVGGLVEKQTDGVPLALKVRFGPKPEAEEAEGSGGKSKPSGRGTSASN